MTQQLKRSAVTLSNAIEVCAGTIHEIAGNGVAKTLDGSPVTRAELVRLVAARLNAKLIHKYSVNRKKGQQ